jgi:hypothetical protein
MDSETYALTCSWRGFPELPLAKARLFIPRCGRIL